MLFMVNYRVPSLLFLAIMLANFPPVALGQKPAETWVGKRVMPKMNCQLKEKGQVIQDSKVNRVPYRVMQVEGDWLLVGDRQPGWVLATDIVPLEQAPAYFSEELKKEPKSTLAYIRRAISYQELRDPQKAIADYTQAITLEPKNSLAFNNRGSAFSQMNEPAKALADFDAAIKLDLNYVLAYVNRGSLHYGQMRYDLATEDFRKAIELDPASWMAHYNLATVLEAEGKIEEAIKEYETTISRNPREPLAFNNLAWIKATSIKESLRDGKKAVELASKACELTEWKDAEFADTLAAACAEAGNWEKAIEIQEYALKLVPDSRKAAMEARLVLYQKKQPFRAQ